MQNPTCSRYTFTPSSPENTERYANLPSPKCIPTCFQSAVNAPSALSRGEHASATTCSWVCSPLKTYSINYLFILPDRDLVNTKKDKKSKKIPHTPKHPFPTRPMSPSSPPTPACPDPGPAEQPERAGPESTNGYRLATT